MALKDYLAEKSSMLVHEFAPADAAHKQKFKLMRDGAKVVAHEAYETSGMHRLVALHKDGAYHVHEFMTPSEGYKRDKVKCMSCERVITNPTEVAHFKATYPLKGK